ncbi:tRNA pseudouridine(13) synthase TruD [Rhabdochromatium marinum]|uniref:tRNA pseudouridine(13) synthase TruD n=1 Tax=Rhabdochromatium marinum TaxID=48729 RepID=UPI001906C296|nr:tRNA pseudouridine(13) synthase TruD [Rhabdochromatium marinum]MBK1650142.1 tRNA pseudouridine(13) synthase TruD [Rhabdochromatium marinum]
MAPITFECLPRAHGAPLLQAVLRACPQDFRVTETLSFTPEDRGSHWLLKVRKTGVNTEWVARQLARLAQLPARDVGYAGLKDRHAVAVQWFSLPLGEAPAPDWLALAGEGIEVLEIRRHGRKLRRGAIRDNAFEITLRDLSGDLAALPQRLAQIRDQGVPNYFGPQRFGHQDANLRGAQTLFSADGRGARLSRHRRGLFLSAARAALFNQVLAQRVEAGHWNRALPGERLQLAGSQAHFLAPEIDAELMQRVSSWDLSPTGPLCGAGEPLVSQSVAELETAALAAWTDWIAGLARAGLRQERRALRVQVADLDDALEGEQSLRLRFRLPAGAYATAVLRELGDCNESGRD